MKTKPLSIPWRHIALIWLASRLFVWAFVLLGHASHPYMEPIAGGFAGVASPWLNPWTTFDSGHFLDIAANGYKPHTVAFFPLYPLALRLFGPGPVAMAAAGFVISNAALLAALGLLFELTRRDHDDKIASATVWLVAFWPTSAFFSAVYTESVFLLFVLAAFLGARRNRWAWAAAWASLAALCKNSGWLLAVALWAEYFQARPVLAPRLGVLAPLAPLACFVSAQGYFASLFGPRAGVASQSFYGRAWTAPWNPILWDARDILAGRALEATTILNVGFTLAGLWILWSAREKQPVSHSILLGGILAMHLSLGHNKPPYTIDTVRYLSTTFPFAQQVAAWAAEALERPRLRRIAFAMWAAACALMSFLFGQKSFVG